MSTTKAANQAKLSSREIAGPCPVHRANCGIAGIPEPMPILLILNPVQERFQPLLCVHKRSKYWKRMYLSQAPAQNSDF